MDLKEIYQPITKELVALEKRLFQILKSPDPSISNLGRYLFGSKGKRLRPALVLLSAKAGKNKKPKQTLDTAAAVELFHAATLIHDDIIDQATLRRGKPPICIKWGTELAILYGDYLYSKSFALIAQLNLPQLLNQLIKTGNQICESEIRNLNRSSQKTFKQADYLKLIAEKTATLFATSCELGASLGEASQKELVALKNFGHNFGMLFQITDDLIDTPTGQPDHKTKVSPAFLKTKARFFALRAQQALQHIRKPKIVKSLSALVDKTLVRKD